MRTSTYTGNGREKTLDIGIKVLFIYIQRATDGNYNGVFSMRELGKYAYIPGTGIVTNAVTEYTHTGLILGSNANVNAEGVTYGYFAIG